MNATKYHSYFYGQYHIYLFSLYNFHLIPNKRHAELKTRLDLWLNSPLRLWRPLPGHSARETRSRCRGALTRARSLRRTRVCRSSLTHTYTHVQRCSRASVHTDDVKPELTALSAPVFPRTCANMRRRTDHFRLRAGTKRWLDEGKRGRAFVSTERLSLSRRNSDWTEEKATSHVTLIIRLQTTN